MNKKDHLSEPMSSEELAFAFAQAEASTWPKDLMTAVQTEITSLQHKIHSLETIISLMPGHIYWKDKAGIYHLCNDRVADVLQLSHRDEIKGKTVYDIMQKPYADLVKQTDEKLMEVGAPLSLEEEGYDNAGNPAIYLTKKVPIKNEQGEVMGLFGLSIDITDRKKMEHELEQAKADAEIASQAKSDFIYNMSHDLRTPFSGILGFAYHLYDIETDENKKTELSYIIQSSEKLLALFNDILHVAKHNEENQFSLSAFNLLELISECRLLFIAELQRKHLQFSVVCDQSRLMVKSDKHRIYRMLVNLLSNAIKFTDEGEITVSVEIQTIHEQDFCLIAVKDTGLGIPPDKLELIFERFTRLTSSYQSNHTGTGIGLWFVRKLVDDLKGEVTVTSQPGEGSTFTCSIPVILMPDEGFVEVPVVEEAVPEHRDIVTRRILIVEDDEITRKMQMTLLRDLGNEVDVVTSGQAALAMTHQPYDMILMDIGLPVMDGFEVAKRIRLECPANRDTLIVGLTAHIGHVEQLKWQTDEINRLILKPLTKSVCLELMQAAERQSCA